MKRLRQCQLDAIHPSLYQTQQEVPGICTQIHHEETPNRESNGAQRRQRTQIHHEETPNRESNGAQRRQRRKPV